MFNTIEFIYIIRIVVAGLCGIVVGLERKNRSKEAGIRTHFVVACGAAIIMVVSKYAFFDAQEIAKIAGVGTEVRVDPSRIASTIASGIGFLGAGMIFVHKNTISGLTTAAGIWATSGIGMAIGSGMYVLGIGATFVILVAQIVLHLNIHKKDQTEVRIFTLYDVDEQGYREYIEEELANRKIVIQSTSIEKNKSGKNYIFTIEMQNSIDEDEIISLSKYDCSLKSAL